MPIEYESAVRLRDAGFPQHQSVWIFSDKRRLLLRADNKRASGRFVAAPNLVELIAACGDAFECLEKDSMNEAKWRAISFDLSSTAGDTPHAAVASLWVLLAASHQVERIDLAADQFPAHRGHLHSMAGRLLSFGRQLRRRSPGQNLRRDAGIL